MNTAPKGDLSKLCQECLVGQSFCCTDFECSTQDTKKHVRVAMLVSYLSALLATKI